VADILTERSGNILSIQTESPRKAERDDVEHVRHDGGVTQRSGKGRSDTRPCSGMVRGNRSVRVTTSRTS